MSSEGRQTGPERGVPETAPAEQCGPSLLEAERLLARPGGSNWEELHRPLEAVVVGLQALAGRLESGVNAGFREELRSQWGAQLREWQRRGERLERLLQQAASFHAGWANVQAQGAGYTESGAAPAPVARRASVEVQG